MNLDNKQKVLIAIYTEYQKDIPNMRTITPANIGIEVKVVHAAIYKLYYEELISNIRIYKDDINSPEIDDWGHVKMTQKGIEYVEELLNIEKTLSGEEKTKNIIKKATEWGYDQLQTFAAKVLAEMIKGQ